MKSNPLLTEREIEILHQVATGASNRQIAQQLHISSNTVKVHLRNIFEKLGVASRTEATLYAIQSGLVEGVESTVVTAARPWWQRGWVIAVGAMTLTMVALLVGILANPGETPSENVVDLDQLERDRWQELAPMPTARKGLAVAAYDGKIYAIAGETADGVTDVVERYDPATDTWETLPPKPTAVTDVQAAVIGGKIYVPGGRLLDGDVTDAVEAYDVQAGEWEAVIDLPHPLSEYAIASYEGKIYLFGGSDGKENLKSTLIFEEDLDFWDPGTESRYRYRSTSAVSGFDGIYLFGMNYELEESIELMLYTPEAESTNSSPWSEKASLPQEISVFGGASFLDIIYIFGVSTLSDKPVVLEYIPQDDRWVENSLSLKDDWINQRVIGSGTFLYALGGEINGIYTDSLGSFKAVYTLLIPLLR